MKTDLANTIRRWAADFTAFCLDAIIQTADGPARFGSIAADFQVDLLKLIAPSVHAVGRGERPPMPRLWAELTKSCGKGLINGLVVAWLCMFATVPLQIQVAAVDKDQAADLITILRGLCWSNPTWKQFDIFRDNIVAESVGKARVEARILSSDIAGSHGARPNLLLIDELHAISDARFEFVHSLLNNAAKLHSFVMVTTNAGIEGSEAHKLREVVFTSPLWQTYTYAKPAPWIPPEVLAEALRRNGSRANRWFFGIWSGESSDALDLQDINDSVRRTGPFPGRQHHRVMIGSLDLSLKSDHAAFTVLGVDHFTEQLDLAHCQSWNPRDYSDGKIPFEPIEEAVVEVHRRIGLSAVVFDPWNCAYLAQRLARRGFDMREWPYSAKNCDIVATRLIEVFRQKMIALYRDEDLLSDLRMLRIQEKTSGSFKLVAARNRSTGSHADRAFALAQSIPLAVDAIAQLRYSDWYDEMPEEIAIA